MLPYSLWCHWVKTIRRHWYSIRLYVAKTLATLLPPASEGRGRYCFHRCLSVHRGYPISIPQYFHWFQVLLWGGDTPVMTGWGTTLIQERMGYPLPSGTGQDHVVADLRGGAPSMCPPTDQIFFNFMVFFQKMCQIYWVRTPSKGLTPPPMTNAGSAPGIGYPPPEGSRSGWGIPPPVRDRSGLGNPTPGEQAMLGQVTARMGKPLAVPRRWAF